MSTEADIASRAPSTCPTVRVSIAEDPDPKESTPTVPALHVDTPHIVKPSPRRPPPDLKLLNANHPGQIWQRSPTRQSTEDIELDERARSKHGRRPGSAASSRSQLPAQANWPISADPILGSSSWRGDVSTFTSAIIAHPESKTARVDMIQARKSNKLPFKHEFLLVYIILAGKVKIARIDRLGKVGGVLGLRQGRRDALQEVHFFDKDHPEAQSWILDKKRNGSVAIATLKICEQPTDARSYAPGPSSGYTHSIAEEAPPRLSVIDVARILSFIQVEMPTYVLTTKNCFMMTRSVLMIMCNCFGDDYFTCYMGETSSPEGAVSSAFLVEPLYNGIVRWYFPVVLSILITYMLTMFVVHWFVEVQLTGYKDQLLCGWNDRDWYTCLKFLESSSEPRGHPRGASQYGGVSLMHMLLDLPIPCAVIHWWLTKMEKEIKSVCLRLRTRIEIAGLGVDIFGQEGPVGEMPPAEPDGGQKTARAYVAALALAIGGSIVLGIYWDKGLMAGIVLFFLFVLVCAFQGDGIAADMESYVRLDPDEAEVTV